MKQNKLIALAIGTLALVSCGGNSSQSSQDYVEVTDMVGRTVQVKPGSYSRVVCIGAGALRLYSYVGDVSKLAGVEDIDNAKCANTDRPKMFDSVARPYYLANKDVFETLPSCGVGGPNAQVAEAEKILSCNPDIIISEYEDADKANALQSQVGVPVVTLSIGSKAAFDEKVQQTITLLGKVFDKETRSASLNAYINEEKEEIQNRTKDIKEEDKKQTYICGLGNWGTTNHLMTSSNFEPFNVANISNVASDVGVKGIGAIEKEKFVELGEKMDVMIVDLAALKNIAPLYKEDPTMFDTCKAWNNGEVYVEMAYNAYYTNIELSLANTWYSAKAVYPNLFKDIDITAKLDEITLKFNGKALANDISSFGSSSVGYKKLTKEFLASF